MGRGAALAVEHMGPLLANEGLRGIEPMLEEQRPDQRFDDIADDIVAGVGLVLARLLAEPDVRRDADRAADLGAAFASHQRIVAAAHLAFGFEWETLVEPARDHQPEDAVAEEFQSLIAVAAVAAVGQRAFVQRFVPKVGAEQLGEEAEVAHGL